MPPDDGDDDSVGSPGESQAIEVTTVADARGHLMTPDEKLPRLDSNQDKESQKRKQTSY